MSALRDRIQFLAEHPEVGHQSFSAAEAQEFLAVDEYRPDRVIILETDSGETFQVEATEALPNFVHTYEIEVEHGRPPVKVTVKVMAAGDVYA